MVRIYPSLMAVDPCNGENEIKLLESHCAGFHLDLMDNHFVSHKALDVDTINVVAQRGKPVWVHMMVEKPELWYNALLLPHDSLVSFHIESEVDVVGFIKIIREKKQRASIAISPKTPLSRIFPFLHDVDQVLLMSVEPGFSGQPFLKSSVARLVELAAHRHKENIFFRIGMDGGIDIKNIKMLVEHGVDDCAIASGIFKHKDHVAALKQLQDAVIR